ncbi:hypothetical protein LR48_Vigan05g037400 [Vigna angularis]|uniref:Uncharacterized protein n=1 Tax=Phaseolus angularis TaxID=3914 RepID=A0A0L9UIP8_PHAAN|nr:hypothetical protein LR48_Vigan05g037400 [Vigna angularis]
MVVGVCYFASITFEFSKGGKLPEGYNDLKEKLVEAKKKSMMKFLRCGGKICMNNNDVENNYKGEEQPSRNVIESSEERRSDEAKAHGWWLLPKKTYDSIKEKKPESDWSEIDDDTIKQERPRRNTVLHIAALYGNDKCVEKIVEIGPELLRARNSNDDTPLHVAARAGKISTLEKLVAALLHRNSEEAKETILVTNKQGNTFFHEALLNGHKNVMNILDSSPALKQLAEDTAFTSRNSRRKSVLHLAIEKGYRDIVDDLLTRVIHRYKENILTDDGIFYYPQVRFGKNTGNISMNFNYDCCVSILCSLIKFL